MSNDWEGVIPNGSRERSFECWEKVDLEWATIILLRVGRVIAANTRARKNLSLRQGLSNQPSVVASAKVSAPSTAQITS